jgi:excisionase family DNA binding protein
MLAPVMVASSEPLHGYQPGLTIGQTASRLNVSPSTVRRWVRSGRLHATQVTVGDGYEYRIPLEALEGMKASVQPSEEATTDPSANGSIPTILEVSVERSTAVAAYNAQLLAPLVTVIEHQAEQLVRQAEQIADLREERGRHTAELERAASTIVALAEERDALKAPQPPRVASGAPGQPAPSRDAPAPSSTRLRALAPWLLAVLAIVAVVALLAWPP